MKTDMFNGQTFSRNDSVELSHYRNCCAIVSIRYLTGEKTKYISHPKYEPIEFVSYVGGIISLWLGFSFISMYDITKWSYEFIIKWLGLKKEKRRMTLMAIEGFNRKSSNRSDSINHLPTTLTKSIYPEYLMARPRNPAGIDPLKEMRRRKTMKERHPYSLYAVPLASTLDLRRVSIKLNKNSFEGMSA